MARSPVGAGTNVNPVSCAGAGLASGRSCQSVDWGKPLAKAQGISGGTRTSVTTIVLDTVRRRRSGAARSVTNAT